MEDLWLMFCGKSDSPTTSGFSYFLLFSQPTSCVNHGLILFLDLLLLFTLLYIFIQKSSSQMNKIPSRFRGFSGLQIASAILNGCIGLMCLILGIWIIGEQLRRTLTPLPLNRWLLPVFQGFTWLSVSLTISLRGKHLPRTPFRLLSVFTFFFSGIICAFSLFAGVLGNETSIKIALDVMSFPGGAILLFCAYKGYRQEEIDGSSSGVYAPLNSEDNGISISPFARAGLSSKLSFWWLNSLMKTGKEKILEDNDIPKLREADTAESCYMQFLEKSNKQKETQLPLLKTIISCHWKEILISGFFALLKIVTLSAGPLLLNKFILVAEGKPGFKYEGYVLALALFVSKSLETLSQRQWYFRSRLIGLKVRSLHTALIYKKQLRLSNSSRLVHSGGEIMNYVSIDAYRIGEFPFWIHQIWTTLLQLSISLSILFNAVGLATLAALGVILIIVLCNAPLAKLQHKFQSRFMVAQDERLRAYTESLVNMKVLKLYAWETHFKNVIEKLRIVELKWLLAVQLRRAYSNCLLWSSPIIVSAATFVACYLLNIPLHANNVFTFIATLRLVQDPIGTIPDVIGAYIQANVAFTRIVKFLEAPEMQHRNVCQKQTVENSEFSVSIKLAEFSWEENSLKPTLKNVDLEIRHGEKVAVCGEVGSGKSTLLAAILGEIPNTLGTVHVSGRIAYVSQTAWIQTGTIQENILFGSAMDRHRYHDTLERCSLVKDLELLPYGDLTQIGERGVNLSGGQKQRIQLARALYQDADLYLLDDPFSAVDAHTATTLFKEYVMEALSKKTIILVTHQVDFLPAFDSVLLMSDGEILRAATYHQLLASSQEFQDLVNAHKETAGSEMVTDISTQQNKSLQIEIKKAYVEKEIEVSKGDQLIKHEEREVGDTGVRPYVKYLGQERGFLYFLLATLCHLMVIMGQISQNSWIAAKVDKPDVSPLKLISVYLVIGMALMVLLLGRALFIIVMGLESSRSLFSQLLNSLFCAPMSFYDSTPLGRILSRVSIVVKKRPNTSAATPSWHVPPTAPKH